MPWGTSDIPNADKTRIDTYELAGPPPFDGEHLWIADVGYQLTRDEVVQAVVDETPPHLTGDKVRYVIVTCHWCGVLADDHSVLAVNESCPGKTP